MTQSSHSHHSAFQNHASSRSTKPLGLVYTKPSQRAGRSKSFAGYIDSKDKAVPGTALSVSRISAGSLCFCHLPKIGKLSVGTAPFVSGSQYGELSKKEHFLAVREKSGYKKECVSNWAQRTGTTDPPGKHKQGIFFTAHSLNVSFVPPVCQQDH